MIEINQNNLFVSIVLGSMVGTGLIELILKLFLSHWLDRLFYRFKLKLKDKRESADALIELLNDPQNSKWPNELQFKSNLLSDKLISIGQGKLSEKLDSYSTEQVMLRDLITNFIQHPQSFQSQGVQKDYVERSAKQDELRKDLVKEVSRLKK